MVKINNKNKKYKTITKQVLALGLFCFGGSNFVFNLPFFPQERKKLVFSPINVIIHS